MSRSNPEHVFKVLIIGDSGVGKSSLLLRYSDNRFPNVHSTTIGVDFKIRTVHVGQERACIQIWDTAGQERFRIITSSYYRGAHAVIVMYDVTNAESFKNVQKWRQEVERHCEALSMVLVGNKNDDRKRKVISTAMAKRCADQLGVELIETSARDGRNVDKVFTAITKTAIRHKQKSLGQDWAVENENSVILHQRSGFESKCCQ